MHVVSPEHRVIGAHAFLRSVVHKNRTKVVVHTSTSTNLAGTAPRCVSIIDTRGRTVLRMHAAGAAEFTLDNGVIPRGVYVVKVAAGNESLRERILLR